jgi:hypothetical protein
MFMSLLKNLPSRAFSGNTYWLRELHSAGRSEMRILTGHWDMRSSDLSSTDLMRNWARFFLGLVGLTVLVVEKCQERMPSVLVQYG